jgi:hypothetical protein
LRSQLDDLSYLLVGENVGRHPGLTLATEDGGRYLMVLIFGLHKASEACNAAKASGSRIYRTRLSRPLDGGLRVDISLTFRVRIHGEALEVKANLGEREAGRSTQRQIGLNGAD